MTIISVQGRPYNLTSEVVEHDLYYHPDLFNLCIHATFFENKKSCKDYVGKHWELLTDKLTAMEIVVQMNKSKYGVWTVNLSAYFKTDLTGEDWLDFLGTYAETNAQDYKMQTALGKAALYFWLSYKEWL